MPIAQELDIIQVTGLVHSDSEVDSNAIIRDSPCLTSEADGIPLDSKDRSTASLDTPLVDLRPLPHTTHYAPHNPDQAFVAEGQRFAQEVDRNEWTMTEEEMRQHIDETWESGYRRTAERDEAIDMQYNIKHPQPPVLCPTVTGTKPIPLAEYKDTIYLRRLAELSRKYQRSEQNRNYNQG